eukprot:9206025-Lingulodinium_polyedra.AAC.1
MVLQRPRDLCSLEKDHALVAIWQSASMGISLEEDRAGNVRKLKQALALLALETKHCSVETLLVLKTGEVSM